MNRLMSVSLVFLCLQITSCSADEKAVEYQRLTDAAEWKWTRAQESLLWCIQNNFNRPQVPQVTCQINWPHKSNSINEFQIHILNNNNEELCSFDAHPNTVFIRKNNMLYVTDFHYMSSGCSVIAFDLKQRKQLWTTRLQGLGPIAHSKYSNYVNIAIEKELVIIYGKESSGRYIELLDPQTGKTVGNKKLPAER